MYAKFHTANPLPRSRRHRWIAAGVLGALAALAVIAVVTSPDATAEPDGFTCEENTSANLVTGSGPGDTSSGQSAILGFHHAFYVDRSAAHAQRFLIPDSALTVDNRLQIDIDAIPAETRHCVSISPLGAIGDSQRWAVTVTEFRPDIEPWITRQTVTTRTVDRVILISEITPA
ncbi:hypothetical protein [Nocardia mangyaensis]|uniref:hypothetical protein n=1 Tax=Nocardia mangyaensis TaxID=2213200 RepID=UPI0026755E59|nr:hypothetical protein [Nocardia mangyaensis]MDO3646145.1 hypothetical protein [Nocardia mangyaensis]